MCDDISRIGPGKRDFVTFCSGNGGGGGGGGVCKKDIFTWSIKEIFDFFLTENPNIKIRLTNFGYLHPEHVKFSSETTANVCTCIYHQSIILTLDSIHKHLQEVLKL